MSFWWKIINLILQVLDHSLKWMEPLSKKQERTNGIDMEKINRNKKEIIL